MATTIPQSFIGATAGQIDPGSALGRWMRAFAHKASTGAVANANLLTPLAQGLGSQLAISSPLGQTILKISRLYDDDQTAELRIKGRQLLLSARGQIGASPLLDWMMMITSGDTDL